jgi:hypothetical protein
MQGSGFPQLDQLKWLTGDEDVVNGARTRAVDEEAQNMRRVLTTALVVGAIWAMPAIGFAQTGKAGTQPAAQHAAKTAVADHSTRGVVKSIDATSLVITRSGKNRGDMTFELNPSTKRDGTINVGTPVSVRYHDDGKMLIATAVMPQDRPVSSVPFPSFAWAVSRPQSDLARDP